MLARRLKHFSVPTEAEEENAKVVLGTRFVVGSLISCACRFCVHRLADDTQGEEDVRANLARVGGRLKKAELNRSLITVPKVVEVQGAVTRIAVVGVAVVQSVVVGVSKLRHRWVAKLEHPIHKGAVGSYCVPTEAVCARSASVNNQLLLLVKNLHEVLKLLRR